MLAGAVYSLSASLVPMYEQQMSKDWQFIINDSAATVLFCSTQEIFERANKEVLPMTSHVHSALCLDAREGEVYGYQTILNDIQHSSQEILAAGIIEPSEDDIANLIYTSGTTGNPKGVELTHRGVDDRHSRRADEAPSGVLRRSGTRSPSRVACHRAAARGR